MSDRAEREPAPGDRYAYWFPLVLLGFLLLGWLGLSAAQTADYPDGGWFAYMPLSERGVSGTGISWQVSSSSFSFGPRRYADYLGMPAAFDDPLWNWFVPIVATFLGTLVWYGWRARRRGSATVLPFVLVAVAGALAIAVGYAAFHGLDGRTGGGWEVISSVGLPLVALGVLAAAWSYFRPGPARRTVAVFGAVSLYGGVCVVVASLQPRLVEPMLIAVGLLVLAWLERSRLLAVVAVAVLAAMVALPTGIFGALVPAAVLLGGGIAALVLRARPATGTMAG